MVMSMALPMESSTTSMGSMVRRVGSPDSQLSEEPIMVVVPSALGCSKDGMKTAISIQKGLDNYAGPIPLSCLTGSIPGWFDCVHDPGGYPRWWLSSKRLTRDCDVGRVT